MYFPKKSTLVGGFNHLEKYESQWEGFFHILWKIKNVPNHQPALNLEGKWFILGLRLSKSKCSPLRCPFWRITIFGENHIS